MNAAARRGIRAPEPERGETIEIEELRIDPREVQAYVDGESCALTPTEFRLLYQLALDRDRVVTRDELLQKLWGRRESRRDRTVDVFVRRLREKIDRRAPRHTFIQTRYGVGYKLEPWPSDKASQGEEGDACDDEDRTGEARRADALVQEDRGEHGGDHDARLAHGRHRRRRRALQREQDEQVGGRREHADGDARRGHGRAHPPQTRRTADTGAAGRA